MLFAQVNHGETSLVYPHCASIQITLLRKLAQNISDIGTLEFVTILCPNISWLDIKLLQIEPGSKNRKGTTTYIPYSMEIKCDYEQFGKFITELEGKNRMISVEEIQIRNGVEKIRGTIDNISEVNDIVTTLSINTITLNKAKTKK